MGAIKGLFQGCILLVVFGCVATLFVAAGSAAPKSTPTPTPADSGAAAAVGEVMVGLEPIIGAAGRSIDAGTAALAADTRTVHPGPKPTVAETWGTPLVVLGVVCVAFGWPCLAVIVWILARAGVFAQIVALMKYNARG